jgi:hypothetical protein
LPGERNPPSAAEEFAPPPQGESVLDASMMAELIVTKKEIGPQLKKSTGTARTEPKSPGVVVNRCSRWKDLEASTSDLVHCLGALVVRVFAASIGTPVEGKIGRYTAEWTLENQGHSHDRQKLERCQRSGRAGLDRALVAAESGSRLPSCNAAPRGGCRPDGRGVAGCPRRMGRARQRHHRWLGRGESLFPVQKRLLL